MGWRDTMPKIFRIASCRLLFFDFVSALGEAVFPCAPNERNLVSVRILVWKGVYSGSEALVKSLFLPQP